MNLTTYIGRAGTGKSFACYERIKEIIEQHPGESIILLVPEPATYKVERELAEFMPNGGFTTVRVVGFGRLGYQVYQSLGMVKEKQRSISKVGRNLLLRLIMKRQGKDLGLLSQAAGRPEFSDVLQSLFSEFKSFQVGPNELRLGASRVSSESLAKKLEEIATFMSAYEEELEKHGEGDGDPLLELVAALPASPLMTNAHVFVDGFHWFTPVHYELINAFVEIASEVVVTINLPTDKKERSRHKEQGALFSRPYEVYETLQTRYGSLVKERLFTVQKRFNTPLLQHLESDFFRSPIQPYEGEDSLYALQGYNRDIEVDGICRAMLRYMEKPGARWRHMGIMLRESETYGDVLEKALNRYEIPHFIDRQRPMKTHPLGELLVALFDVVRLHYDHDVMFRLLKTDLLPFSRNEVDELENYCLEFGIRYFQWEKEEWTYRRKGYAMAVSNESDDSDAVVSDNTNGAANGETSATPMDSEEERLRRVNTTHKAIMTALEPWFDFAVKAHTGREWCERLYNLMVDFHIPEQLYKWTEEAETASDTEAKASHEQMYQAVLSFFDEVMTIADEDELTLDEMALLMAEGLEDVNYSMIPPTLDHVVVTTVERGYSQSWNHVFVMGLNQGIFPQSMGDEGLIKDRERQELAAAGIVLAEGALPKAFNENFLLYLACTRGKYELTLSYASAGSEGDSLEKSLIINRLISTGFIKDTQFVPLTISAGTAEAYLWRPYQSLALLSARWGELLSGKTVESVWWGLYNWARTSETYEPRLRTVTRGIRDDNMVPLISTDVVNGLFLKNNSMSGSVTRLEKFQQCPFSFYAQYGLKLEKRRIKSFGSPEIGTFLHENLRRLGEMLLSSNRQWRDIGAEERQQLCTKVASDIINEDPLIQDESTPYQQHVEQRLVGTLEKTITRLSEWSSKSSFDTVVVEQSFGSYDGWPAIEVPLGNDRYMKLRGQIDRVDEWTTEGQTYGIIVDYKSGGTHVSGKEVYYGLKLQLMIYLLALENAHKRQRTLPAAAVYTYIKNPRTSSDTPITKEEARTLAETNKDLKNSGYFANNVDLLTHMDDIVPGGQAPEFVPIRIKKDGTIYSSDLNKVKTTEEFGIMTEYAESIMAKAGSQIGQGKFPIAPYQMDKRTPCAYCDYKTVCRFDSTRNFYRYLSSLGESQALDKMRETVGKSLQKGGDLDGEMD